MKSGVDVATMNRSTSSGGTPACSKARSAASVARSGVVVSGEANRPSSIPAFEAIHSGVVSIPDDSTRLALFTMFPGANAPVPRIDAVIGPHERRGEVSRTFVLNLLADTMRLFHETTTDLDGSSSATRSAMTTFQNVRLDSVCQITKGISHIGFCAGLAECDVMSGWCESTIPLEAAESLSRCSLVGTFRVDDDRFACRP